MTELTTTIPVNISDITTVCESTRRAELHLYLEDGQWRVIDADVGVGDGTRIDVSCNRVRVYTLASHVGPTCYDAAKVSVWLEEHRPLLDRIAAGHSEDWDGNNNIGVLTADASEANEELSMAIGDCMSDLHADTCPFLAGIEAWNVGEWLAEVSWEDISDETAAGLVEQFRSEGVLIIGGVESVQEAMDELRAGTELEGGRP